jgi:hypothetical protein
MKATFLTTVSINMLNQFSRSLDTWNILDPGVQYQVQFSVHRWQTNPISAIGSNLTT